MTLARFALAISLCLAATPSSAAEPTLADALKVIQGKQLVDLTHSFSPTTPVSSGFGQATMSAACDSKTHRPFTIEQDGFRTIFYSLVGQYGTHVDPPAQRSSMSSRLPRRWECRRASCSGSSGDMDIVLPRCSISELLADLIRAVNLITYT